MKRSLILLFASLVLLTLPGCADGVQTLEAGGAQLCLPAGYEARQQTGGGLTLLFQGRRVGGVNTLCLNQAHCLKGHLADDTMATSLQLLRRQVRAADQTLGYVFTASPYGDFALTLETEQGWETHSFFIARDQIWDLWVWDSQLSQEEADKLLAGVYLTES